MYIYTHSHIYVCIKYCLSPYKELMSYANGFFEECPET